MKYRGRKGRKMGSVHAHSVFGFFFFDLWHSFAGGLIFSLSIHS